MEIIAMLMKKMNMNFFTILKVSDFISNYQDSSIIHLVVVKY